MESIIKDNTNKSNLKKRTLASIVDYGFFLSITFAYIMYFGEPDGEGGYSVKGILALVVPIAWFLYFVVVETINEATLGHQAFNLSVKTEDGKSISLKQSFKRHLLDPIDIFMFGIPARIAIKNSDKNQRLGDMWAKTIMIDLTDKEQI